MTRCTLAQTRYSGGRLTTSVIRSPPKFPEERRAISYDLNNFWFKISDHNRTSAAFQPLFLNLQDTVLKGPTEITTKGQGG